MLRITLLSVLFLVSLPVAAATCGSGRFLVELDEGGIVASGSKQDLMAAFERGVQLRVGWQLDWDSDGKPDISHWADAVFLSAFEGELFAQLPTIAAQAPKPGEATIELRQSARHWSGMLGTNGVLVGRYGDEESRSFRVRSLWCAVSD